MKQIVVIALYAVLITACAPNATPAPTVTPTATATALPTATPKPTVPQEVLTQLNDNLQKYGCVHFNPSVCKDLEVLVFNEIQLNGAEKANGITEILCIATSSIYADKDSEGNVVGEWRNEPMTYAYAKKKGTWQTYGQRWLAALQDDYELERADASATCGWMERN